MSLVRASTMTNVARVGVAARRARGRHRDDSPDECVPAAVASASLTSDDGVVYLPDGVRAMRVDAREPVAQGAGAHAHCVMSAKLARAVGARAGAWVELRKCFPQFLLLRLGVVLIFGD